MCILISTCCRYIYRCYSVTVDDMSSYEPSMQSLYPPAWNCLPRFSANKVTGKRRCSLHMHPVIYPFFSVACDVFFMFLCFWLMLQSKVVYTNQYYVAISVWMYKKNYEIYRNKLQSDLLSVFESLAAQWSNSGSWHQLRLK